MRLNRISPSRLSLFIRFPLLISALVLGVIITYAWISYRGVRSASLEIGSERLRSLSDQLSTLFQQSSRNLATATRSVAVEKAVVEFIGSGGRRSKGAAVDAMQRIGPPRDSLSIVELWDIKRNRVFSLPGQQSVTNANLDSEFVQATRGPDFFSVGRIRMLDTLMYYPVATLVTDKDKEVGYLVRWRRLSSTAQAREQLSKLLGSGALLYLGNNDGKFWTDLVEEKPEPPEAMHLTRETRQYARPGSETVLASARPVPGTNWVVLVEFPLQGILVASDRFLQGVTLIGAVLLAISLFAAWALGRSITKPLNRFSKAVAAISGGDYTHVVDVATQDEFGKLAGAFNSMVDQVKARSAELRVKAEEYRLLFETNPLPMWVFDAETLAFLEVNKAAVIHYGYSRDEFLAMTIRDIRPTEELKKLDDDLSQRHEGLDKAGVWKHKKKDGTVIDVEITSHKILFSGRGAKIVLANDLSERRRAELSLREREQRLSSIYDTTADVIFHLEVEKGQRYRFISVNNAFVKTTGIQADQVVGRFVNDIIPEPSLTLVLTKYAKAIQEKKIVRWEETSDYPTGRLTGEVSVAPAYDESGNCTHLVGAVHDITERKKAEDDLRNAEFRYRNTLDHMLEGCQIIGFDYTYLYLNDVAAQHGRIAKEKLLGHTMMEVYPGIDRTPFFSELRECMEKRVARRLENEFTYPDGSKGWFQLSLEPVPEGTFILSADITKEKQLADELKKHQEHLEELVVQRTEQLEAANKELEAFSYSVSHDLRAPLRHIHGFVEMLHKKAVSLDEQSKRFLIIISDSARQMGALIDDLLVFSRLSRTDMFDGKVNMSALVKEVISSLNGEAGQRSIQWKVDALPEVRGDASMLRVVMSNLLSNALKYTRPREKASIHIRSTVNDADEIVFSVEDNGVGFDMTYAHKLFGVFQRLHNSADFEGTGIGLATVRRVIHRHGGKTWAEGSVDQGAKLYFSLPQHKEKTDAQS